jgi:hypothetical protein
MMYYLEKGLINNLSLFLLYHPVKDLFLNNTIHKSLLFRGATPR